MRIEIFVLLGLLAISCRHDTSSSSVKEFVPTPKDLEGETQSIDDFKLERVADIPQFIETASPEFDEEAAEEDDQFDPFGPDHKVWRVSFGKLSEAQFQKLQSTYYRNPLSKFDPKREYILQDFMPPQIQALSGLRFKAERVAVDIPGPPTDQGQKPRFELQTLSNCWNMSFEILRADSKATEIFYIEPEVARTFYQDRKYFDVLNTYSMKDTLEDADKRNEGLKPFDQMLVFSEGQLIHVATYIDKDFFFEKTGPDSLLNYRFTKYEEIAETYLTWKDAMVTFVRFKAQTLPRAGELFSLKALDKKFPPDFIDQAFLERNPNLLSKITHFTPTNFKKTPIRTLYTINEAPLEFDQKTSRYRLNKAAFKAIMQKPEFH